jgi:hypothetical protein
MANLQKQLKEQIDWNWKQVDLVMVGFGYLFLAL